MKIAPRAEVEQLAREQYRQRFEKAPEPVVINREPLLALSEQRAFAWGGRHFRAPQTSYLNGVRFLVAADALRDLIRVGAPPDVMRQALRTVARLIRVAIHPVGLLSRLAWAIRCPFAHADAVDVEGLLRWLIDAPDKSPVHPQTEAVTIDLIDGLMSFAREFPALMRPDGFPISYRHYRYGTRHLGRLAAREDLRQATAARFAQMDKTGWQPWEEELKSAAGWAPRHG